MRISTTVFTAALTTFGFVQLAAADDTDNMAVNATVVDACTISAGALAFGTYDTITHTQKLGQATLSLQCTTGAAAKVVTLGEGAQPASAAPTTPFRQMVRTGFVDMLTYKLYSDVGRTTVWGATAGTGLATAAWTSSTIPQTLTVYGAIDADQDVPAGSYTDSVVATIIF